MLSQNRSHILFAVAKRHLAIGHNILLDNSLSPAVHIISAEKSDRKAIEIHQYFHNVNRDVAYQLATAWNTIIHHHSDRFGTPPKHPSPV